MSARPKYREVDFIHIGLKHRVTNLVTGDCHEEKISGIIPENQMKLEIKLLNEDDVIELGFKHIEQKLEAEDAAVVDTFELEDIILKIMFPDNLGTITVNNDIMFSGYIESQMDLMALVRCASAYITEEDGEDN